jgi:hypothetical protein
MRFGLKINKTDNVYFYCQAVQAFQATSMQISAQYNEDNLRRNFFCQLPVFVFLSTLPLQHFHLEMSSMD